MEARSQYLQAEEFELARTVTGNLSNVLVISGFYDGVRKLNEELLNYERYPSCMSEIAGTYLLQGDYDLARIWFKRSIDASAGSNQEEIGFALNGIASIDLKTGDYEAAKENLGKAVKIVQQIGDKAGEAAIWHQLAMIDLKKGDDEAAREKFEKSTKIAQEIGERRIEASNWHNLASIDLRKGDYEAAKKNLVKAMKIRQQIGDRAGEASTWNNMASINQRKGDYEAAKESIGKAMEIVCQIGDKAGEASAWHNLASIDLHKGDYEAALKNFKKAMKIRQQIWDREGEASTFYQLGILAWNQGHSPEGLRLMALACFMDSSIGHVDAKNDFEALSGMASELKYTQGQTEAMLKEVVEAYKVDRGQSLIDAAFPKVDPDASSHQ